MKADHQSYRRATSTSLLGAVLQVGLGLPLLIYAYKSHDHAAFTAAGYVLLGLVSWIVLAILFDQHRRERIEALEAESLAAADARAASAFEGTADDLRVAGKRLAWLTKWFLPGVSLVYGAALIAWGYWRFRHQPSLGATPPTLGGWGVAIGLGIAFIGFIYARYVSGMAKQAIWANLRAGSACIVGTAVFAALLAIGHGVAATGSPGLLPFLNLAIPISIAVLGAEVYLNFVLEIYRPRKAGDTPRLALESRILSFVAAPDRVAESIADAINYQFGYNVTRGWFYQLIDRSLWKLVVFAAGVLWLLTSLVVLRPDQSGLVLRFGALSHEVGPGLSLKWPWPIERVEVPVVLERPRAGYARQVVGRTTTGIRTIHVGTPAPDKKDVPVLWTSDHTSEEKYLVVQPSYAVRAQGAPGGVRGPDLMLMAVEVPIHYAIKDVKAYETLAPPTLRDAYLQAVASRVITRHISTLTVDEILGPRRPEIASELRALVEREFAELNVDPETGAPRGAGVTILFMGIEGAHPPQGNGKQVAMAFEGVTQQQQRSQGLILAARADAATSLINVVGKIELAQEIVGELAKRDQMKASGASAEAIAAQELGVTALIQRAGGYAASVIAQASGERWEVNMRERARLATYRGLLDTYLASPAIFRATRYFDTLASAIADTRLYITSDGVPVDVRVNLEDTDTGVSVFEKAANPEENQ